MLRILLLSFLAIANSQNVIEIGGNPRGLQLLGLGGARTASVNGLSSLFGNRYSSLANNLGGVQGYQVVALRPQALNVGYGSYGLGGLSGISGLTGLSGLNYGIGSVAVRPSAVNIVAAQPQSVGYVAAQPQAVSYVAAQPQAVSYVAAQPANIGVVSGFAQRAVSSAQQVVPVSAAIHSTRTVEYKAVPYSDEPLVPQVVEVEASEIPLNIHFKSRSSTIQVSQSHTPGEPGTVEQTSSQDEPSRVIHEVNKPIVQEVREVIQPYRQVTQEVQPVIEQIHTVVARGEGVRQQYIAQPQVVQQTVQEVRPQVQYQVAQVAQPVAQFQAVAQPVATFQAVSQPAATFQAIAQPVSTYQASAQPVSFGQAVFSRAVSQPISLSFAQPAGAYFQSVRNVQQPAITGYSIESQPAVSSFSVQSQPAITGYSVQSQPAVSGFSVQSQPASISVGRSVGVQSASLPAGSSSFSRTFVENSNDDDQKK